MKKKTINKETINIIRKTAKFLPTKEVEKFSIALTGEKKLIYQAELRRRKK